MGNQLLLNRVYDKDYFSGTQAALYIGDVFVDEVASYAFRVNQSKTPIYGYASDLFDAVTKGPVLVTGQLAINFKESAYLYLILMRYKRLESNASDILKVNITDPRKLVDTFVGNERDADKSRIPSPFELDDKKIVRQVIERILQGNVSKEERYSFYQALAGFASIAGQDTTFEHFAEAFEDAVWGVPSNNLDKLVTRTDDSFFNNFYIYFTYRNYNNPQANPTI